MYRSRSRKVDLRTPRNIVLVVVEGETERNYFNGLKERDSDIKIVLERPGPADPFRLVKTCIDHMEDKDVNIDDGDLAICAFDMDENPPERIARAAELARENGMIIALSNPCFELWLALHYQDVYRPVDRREATAMVKKHFSRYTKTCDLGAVIARRENAMRRSRRLMGIAGATDAMDLIDLNPASSMHIALEAIDALKERNRGRRSVAVR